MKSYLTFFQLCLFLPLLFFTAAIIISAEEGTYIKIISPSPDDLVAGKVRIIAQAYENDGTIEKVEFYIDKKLVFTAEKPPYAFVYDFGPVPTERSIKCLAYINGLVKTTDAIKTKAYKITYMSKVKIIEIHTSVFDKKNKPIKSLSIKDFVVYDNEVEQKITHFDKEKIPLYLVFLFDKSASMKYNIEKTKLVTKNFISNIISKNDFISFIAFDDKVHLITDFTNNIQNLFKEIDKIQSGGGTALNDAIAYSYSLFTKDMRRKAIVIISDGKDETSHLNFSQTLNFCKKGGIPIFSIAQGKGIKTKELREYLKIISENTGGIAIASERIENLQSALSYIEEIIKSQYLLGYEINENYPKGWHYIKVKLKYANYSILYTPTMYLEE